MTRERLLDELECLAIILLWLAICGIVALIAAGLGNWYWGILGRLGVNSPPAWLIGFGLGFAQVCAVFYALAHRFFKGAWPWQTPIS